MVQSRWRLDAISEHNKVNVYWIPGHKGIKGNEKADELAKKGGNLIPIGPSPFCGAPLTLVREAIDRYVRDKLKQRWDKYKVNHTRKFIVNPSDPITTAIRKEAARMSREDLKGTIEIITGHCKLRKHLHCLGLADTPLCRWCGSEDETPWHLLAVCRVLERKRVSSFGIANFEEIKHDFKCKDYLNVLKKLAH